MGVPLCRACWEEEEEYMIGDCREGERGRGNLKRSHNCHGRQSPFSCFYTTGLSHLSITPIQKRLSSARREDVRDCVSTHLFSW
ncbi:hypothetical protein ANANG_G00009300 [Anguilla anguilla]|uniref:Uncharacterized protein n=1 Tax=Anguilla anguilla TaxID=7936 RepID=A0A9D3MZI6_ANGAN|nr:hypothetical protein ANANG_G00009300 [Anguilla anguilla]